MRFVFWILVVWGSQITLSYHLSTLKIACRGDQISLNSGKRTSGGNYVENTVFKRVKRENSTIIGNRKVGTSDKISFPELDESGFNETALRSSLFGKLLFGVLDNVFPILKEPNWYDIYDPPLTKEENMELPYFDGNDFINSTWTVYIRHRYGVWNWLDRMGLVPVQVHKVFFRPDGRTVWSDHFYGDWFLNPALNYFQFERHYGRGQGIYQYWRLADSLKESFLFTHFFRGIRIFQVQKWNFEEEVGRYWQRGLRSYLRNETNFWALEGRIWSYAVKWRAGTRDQGKFIAIRDGINVTEVFGGQRRTPWSERFHHAMSLPFYQAHPDQLERIEDNFDNFYKNQQGSKMR